MPLFLKRFSQIHTIIALRSVAIVIQFFLILFVNIALNYELPWMPLLAVIATEIIFTLVSYFYYSGKEASKLSLFGQICADIAFLALLLYFTGGATNAFVSLLLLPISIAAVTLTSVMLSMVALFAVASYSVLLWLLPMHVMHGNMEGHFIAMWINFLFSAIVVATVVGKMARSINQRELAISVYREEQLKQEKVIALGVASAQVTHQLATPMATVQLLADELEEDFPNNPVIEDMQQQLTRCRESLDSFRQMVFDIKQQATEQIKCTDIIYQIEENLNINYPDINVAIRYLNEDENQNDYSVIADASLLPAILNLVNNGIRATKSKQRKEIELTSGIIEQKWQLEIRDYGPGFSLSELAELGVKPVASEQGLGMAVLLSHASLERLGGKLALTNHHQGGALVTLTLPIAVNR